MVRMVAMEGVFLRGGRLLHPSALSATPILHAALSVGPAPVPPAGRRSIEHLQGLADAAILPAGPMIKSQTPLPLLPEVTSERAPRISQ